MLRAGISYLEGIDESNEVTWNILCEAQLTPVRSNRDNSIEESQDQVEARF